MLSNAACKVENGLANVPKPAVLPPFAVTYIWKGCASLRQSPSSK